MILDRMASLQVERSLRKVPVTAILGPRQCGKTTLTKMMLRDRSNVLFLDLEKQSDVRALSDPEAFFALHRDKIIAIDEIQRAPELFPAMRVDVDASECAGRFLVTGSASPHLLKQSSETLAGRIRYIELTPLLACETESSGIQMRTHWLRGGFPRSLLAGSDEDSFEWLRDFTLTYLERDLPSLGLQVATSTMQRFWTMLAYVNAQTVNRSKLGESLGVSHHTIQRYLEILRDSFMIRLVEPFDANVKKRLVKSPKIYFRDTGLLHSLSGVHTQRQLLSHPDYGSSWEAFAIENICAVPGISDKYRCFFYGTHGGGEIDLILDDGARRVAVEFKVSSSPDVPRHLPALLRDTGIEEAWIVAPVPRVYPLSAHITAGTPIDFVKRLLG